MSPIGLLVCGPSGVGKTSNINKMLKNAGIHKELIGIDPDERNEETHEERSKAAIEAVKYSIDKGYSFYYAATCGGVRIVTDLIQRMKVGKYRIIIAIVYTSLPVALERIRKRTAQPVPTEVVEDLHAFFKTKAERYMKLDVEIYLYNNETDFNLLLSKRHKKIVCRDGDSDFYFDISRYCSGIV
jgi:predicted ABC-type ATPase